MRAERVSRNSAVEESSITGTPGMNLRESSLGVVSVWMNIERSATDRSDEYRDEITVINEYIQCIGLSLLVCALDERAVDAVANVMPWYKLAARGAEYEMLLLRASRAIVAREGLQGFAALASARIEDEASEEAMVVESRSWLAALLVVVGDEHRR